LQEKQEKYLKAPSGGPLVQHALLAMFEKMNEGKITIEKIVEMMAHNPAILFQIENRGFIREGYYADVVIVNKAEQVITQESLLYKCGWSPFEGQLFNYSIDKTFVNGNLVYTDGKIIEGSIGQRLYFNR